jgi:cytochrome c oxidase subunit 3
MKNGRNMSSTIYQPVGAEGAPLEHQGASTAATPKVRTGHAEASRSGIWVGIFAITMSFAAFTSALFVRQGSGADWTHIVLPSILYANTLALLLSSVTLEMSRRAILSEPLEEGSSVGRGLGWLSATLALGVVFVAGQYEAWRQLGAEGLYLATNPNSSFYYVITALHGLHLLAGMAALLLVMARVLKSHGAFRRHTFEVTAIYWHFMGVLWLYVLLVLRARL